MSKKYLLIIAACGILLLGSLYWYLVCRGGVPTKRVEDVDTPVGVEKEGTKSIELERPPFLNNAD